MLTTRSATDETIGFKLPGTIVPPLTPFTREGKVDYPLLKGIVDYVVEDCDASMVIVAGVEAQEYQFLTLEDRRELIEKTIAFVDGRRPTVVGISHPSVRIAAQLGQFAQKQGANAIQLLAPLRPTGGAPSTKELIDYYQAVLAETELPMMLYLNAGPGADVSVPATIELSSLDRIDYVKESSRDLARVSRLIAEIEGAGHARYFTTMQMWLATLTLGGSGVTLPPPAAKIARAIANAVVEGDFDSAARLQKQYSVWPARWMGNGLAAVMKASLNHLGVPAGDPFPPYEPLSGAALESLHRHLDTMNLTKKGG